MQTVRALRRVTEPSRWVRSVSNGRSFSALSNFFASDVDIKDQILVEGKAKPRVAILSSPTSLNAYELFVLGRSVKEAVRVMGREPSYFICFNECMGSGKTFCSGADVLPLYHSINEGNAEECKHFLQNLYQFVYLQVTYLKPNVRYLDFPFVLCILTRWD